MKITLLKKNSIIKRPRTYLGIIILLFASGFSFASTKGGVSNKAAYAVTRNVNQAEIVVNGTVTSLTGQSIPGVTVKVKGTQVATVTDGKGRFSIKTNENSILVFSYIGYDPVEVSVNGKNVVNVTMEEKRKDLNEVVVVGYGTQKKTSVTGAVSTLAVKNIAQKPVENLTNSLVGRVSGVIATQGSGEPGFDGSNLLIRGPATPGRTNPLTVVDGVPRDFSRLDPNSIETVTILKDASAVAPYGVAGANGVILITTKQGKIGKPTISYNGYFGIQNPTNIPKFTNSYEYALLRNEAAANDGLKPTYSDADIALFKNHLDPDGHPDAHPLEEIIKRNRPISYHNISLTGGTDALKYFASVGYNHQSGMWDPTYVNKFNGAIALTSKVTNTTTVNLTVNGYEEDQHYPFIGAGSILNQAQRQAPVIPVQYSNGIAAGYQGAALYGQIYTSGRVLTKNKALQTQISIDQKLPIKGLSIKGVLSYDTGPDPLGFSNNQTFIKRTLGLPSPYSNAVPPTGVAPGPGVVYTYPIGYTGPSKPTLREEYGDNTMITYQGLLNYSRTFGKSTFTGVLVTEYRKVNWQTFQAFRQNYSLNINELDYGGSLPTDVTVGGTSGGQKQIGYVYRLGYNFDQKYLLEVSGRYDGSYVFAPGHRFGFFPAVSAGWRISQEKFMQDITWINNLKIRGSYGVSGNYPNGGQYQYLSQFNVNPTSAVLGGNATQGINEALQGNPNITWEKSKKTDVGFEATLWNGALGIEADYFNENRSNFLVTIGGSLPAEYGVQVGQSNGGYLTNHGIELTLTSHKNFSKDLRLDVTGTFTWAKNIVKQKFEGAGTYNSPFSRQTGKSLGEQFGLKALGYYTAADFVDPSLQYPVLKPGIPIPGFGTVRPGDIKFADINGPSNNGKGDGKIDINDVTDIGHPQTPQIIYGLEPRLTYKGFDLDFLVQGSAISSIRLSDYWVEPFVGNGSATESVYHDHWTPSTPNAKFPRVAQTPSANNRYASSWFVRNDAYVRLKSAELGYTFSSQMLGHVIQSLRVYTAAQNLFLWTPYMKEPIDPENNGNNQNYYQQKVITFGINATF